MVPVHVPCTIFGKYVFFSCGDPRSSSASTAPVVSSGHSENDRFADFHISITGVATSFGSACPPNSDGNCSAFQPPPMNALYASLNPFGVVTFPSAQCEPSSSPDWLSGASTSPEKR